MTMTDRSKISKSINRRTLLKGAAGVAGLAAGSGAITGFPYVQSAEPKVLRYLGTAVNEGDEISKKCFEDTGIKIENITPVFTKGQLPNGKKIGSQGTAPSKVLYLDGPNSKTFSATPTEYITLIPTVYNADTL